MLMKSTDKEIEIVIASEFTKFAIDSYVRGFHVYQTLWSLIIAEEDLECRHEKENEDEFAIGIYRYDLQRETLVGHVPGNIYKFVYKFLQLLNWRLYCRVTGNRLNRGTGYS